MPMGRPKAELVLQPAEQAQVQAMVRARSIPAALRARAQIVLASAGGESNRSVGARLGLTHATVGKWRRRFIERRITGLYDELRPGKPRTIDDERVAELIQTTLHSKPLKSTLVRAVAFFLFASAYWALLPVIVRQVLQGGALLYGVRRKRA